jgi:hypothetical protein
MGEQLKTKLKPLEPTRLKLVPTKLIRKIAPEPLSRTNDLQELSTWRQSLSRRREKLEALVQHVRQMEADLTEEETDWAAEARRLWKVTSLPMSS